MLVSLQKGSGCFGVEKNRFTYRDSKLGPPSSSPASHMGHIMYNVLTLQNEAQTVLFKNPVRTAL